MTSAIRGLALTVGAAALLSAQAVYAAPATPVTAGHAADPLVSLSILGTNQSRAAVCGLQAAGTTCGLPMMMAATAAASAAQEPPPPPPRRQGVGTLPVILGFLIILGIAAAILSGGDDSRGDLAPISPA